MTVHSAIIIKEARLLCNGLLRTKQSFRSCWPSVNPSIPSSSLISIFYFLVHQKQELSYRRDKYAVLRYATSQTFPGRMDGTQPEGSAPTPEETSTISLRILSPSFEATQRLSFEKLSLSTTVGDVKNLIAPLAPNHPTPEQQRLIYRGRPLLNNSAALESVLEPPLVSCGWTSCGRNYV